MPLVTIRAAWGLSDVPKRKVGYLLLFGAALWLLGSAVAQTPSSRVEGNQFISPANPKIRLSLSDGLKYLGVVPFKIDSLAAGHRYVFVRADEGKHIQQMFIVQQEGFLPSSSEIYRYAIRNPVRLGKFDYWHSVLIYDNEKNIREEPGKEADLTLQFLKAHGYQLESELVMSRFARPADAQHKHEVIFFCYENLSAYGKKLAELPHDSDGDATGLEADEIKKREDQSCRDSFQVVGDE